MKTSSRLGVRISYEIEAAADNVIVLRAIAATEQSEVVGVNFFVTGPFVP